MWDLKGFQELIRARCNFTIVKYGDGPILNMMSENDQEVNCDGVRYTEFLKYNLQSAYIYFLINRRTYICKWEVPIGIEMYFDHYFANYYDQHKFLEYNILIHKLPFKQEMIDFYKAIKNSTRRKIYITNDKLAPIVKQIFSSNESSPCETFIVEEKDCADFHLSYLSKLLKIIHNDCSDDNIIMTSCGTYAAVLIHALMQHRPDNTYIDIGSSFDGLYRHSRDFNGSEEYKQKMSEIYLKE